MGEGMRTIAFVSLKGGSGKTTLAASLAVAAQAAGERVALIDMDPQGALIAWAEARGSADIPVARVGAARLPRALAGLAAGGSTLAIVDAPGAEGLAASAAMAAATLAIVPSRPSLYDVRASAATRAALTAAQTEFVFVLNQLPPGDLTARARDGIETLAEMGGLIAPPILARPDYGEAVRRGRGVAELDPGGAAAEEMGALWASVRRRLAGVRPKSRRRRAA